MSSSKNCIEKKSIKHSFGHLPFVRLKACVGRLKMREWKMREQIAGVENAEVENAGVENAGVD